MKKYFTFQDIVLYITVLVSVGTIITLFSTFSSQAYSTFFSTDTLYLPSIYKDIFIDHNPIKGWHLNPSPNFFPDMIVYFIIMAITSNFITASFVFAIIQYLFFIYLINRLLKTIDLPDHKLITALSSLLLLLFFMVSFYSNDFWFTFYLVSNSYHTGAFLMSLLCIVLSLEYLKKPKTKILVYLIVISTLCVFSDRLFIVLYIIPWFALLVFYFKIDQRKGLRSIIIANISSTIVGMFAFLLLKNSHYIYIDEPHRIMDFKYMGECLKLLMHQMYIYLTDMNFKSIIIILSLIAFIYNITESVIIWIKKTSFTLKDIYIFLSVAFTIIVFIAPVINGNYTGFDTLRYNIYIFYMLIINLGIAIYYLINRLSVKYRIILTSIIAILIIGSSINIITQFNHKELKAYFNYYPKITEDIDEISKQEKLQSGLGNYWNTKVINMFSKNGVRVYTSIDAIYPWGHVMNENWYNNDRFNFIISDNQSQDSIITECFNGKVKFIEHGDIRIAVTPEFIINPNTHRVEIAKE